MRNEIKISLSHLLMDTIKPREIRASLMHTAMLRISMCLQYY